MSAVAAKSDAVTAWKCTITDTYRRSQTLTDADHDAGLLLLRRVTVSILPQCDWALDDYCTR